MATLFIRAALLVWLVNQQSVLLGTAAAREWPSGRSPEFGVGGLDDAMRCHEAVVWGKVLTALFFHAIVKLAKFSRCDKEGRQRK